VADSHLDNDVCGMFGVVGICSEGEGEGYGFFLFPPFHGYFYHTIPDNGYF